MTIEEGAAALGGAKVLLSGVELARAVVKGEEGERRDCEEGGVIGVGVEV